MEVHLDFLCEKINRLEGFRPLLLVAESGKLKINRRLQSRAQGVFSWSVGDWIVRVNFTTDPTTGQPFAGAASRLVCAHR
jgi:hypothetical protein